MLFFNEMQAFPCPLVNVLVMLTAVVCLKAMCGTTSKELCFVVLALLYDHTGIVPVSVRQVYLLPQRW